MKKTLASVSKNLPVSRKAYKGFIERICAILGDSEKSHALTDALSRYLQGDERYADALDYTLRLAFAFLRQDVDKAIARSSKARQRAALRKAQSHEPQSPVSEQQREESRSAHTINLVKPSFIPAPNPPLSRRERRAINREKKAKFHSIRYDKLRSNNEIS